jgi:crotonobetainyl-CoA:carnitine CoA-transferase CaiB-like acyl-CoA transferase
MNLVDLVRALLAFDALTAREWVAAAARSGLVWAQLSRPEDLSADELALAAGVVELLAERAHQEPPTWTRAVGSGRRVVYLVRAAATMPRLRMLCETEGPESLRRRGFLAPPEFLTVA